MNQALLFILVVAAVYGHGLGYASLWDIDEGIYAGIARHMAESGDWVFPVWNGEPRFDKPPLIYWISAAAMRLLGPSELAARVGAYAFAVLCAGLVYAFGRTLYSHRAGIIGALALASTLGWFVGGRIGLMDTGLSFFVGLSTFLLVAPVRRRGDGGRPGPREDDRPAWVYACAGVSLALGVLTKGPVAVILFGGAALAYLGPAALVRHALGLRGLSAAAAFLAAALPWHLAVYARAGRAWWDDYFGYHMFSRFTQPLEDHGFGWYFYLIVLAIGFLPWTGYLVAAAWSALKGEGPKASSPGGDRLLWGWSAFVLIFFSISRTKLPGYILPAFLPLAVLTGAWCDRRLSGPGAGKAFGAGLWASLAAGVLTAAGLAALRPLAPVGYEEAYRLLFLFPGALVAGMLVTLAAYYLSREPKSLLYGFAGTAFAGMLLFSSLLMPLVEEFKPVRPLSQAALSYLQPGTVVVSAMGDASASFYMHRKVIYARGLAELREALASAPDALALVPRAMLAELPGAIVLAEHGPGALIRLE